MVVGNPGSRRVELFQAALGSLGLPRARVVPYLELLAGRVALDQVVREGTWLRIESPGQDFEVERALLAEGADVEDDDGATRIDRAEALRLDFDRGRIVYPRQWYLGFCKVLRLLERQRASCPRHSVMNSPGDIAVLFDKVRCHEHLVASGVTCPHALGAVRSYDELRHRMGQEGIGRVFVKLAHGSSASGVVAFEARGARQQAFTTVEMVRERGELRLYNSRRIRRYERTGEVAALIDTLCRERVHVEQWVPKAGLAGQAFDLRVVVIAGRVEHVVVRMSRGPMTNLHLKNRRGDLAALRDRMAPEAWEAAATTCARAARAFPDCLYAGVDLLVAPGYRRHAVAEVNAFGDLLPGALSRGHDTYSAEMAAVLALGEEGGG